MPHRQDSLFEALYGYFDPLYNQVLIQITFGRFRGLFAVLQKYSSQEHAKTGL